MPTMLQRKVCIFDRSGRLQEEISLPAVEIPVSTPKAPCCTALQWDPSSEVLALLPAGNTFIYLWHAASKELQRIETDFKVCTMKQCFHAMQHYICHLALLLSARL
jgi:hypothetical protein